MTRTAEVLGNTPPRSWDSLDAGLVRLEGLYRTDVDTPRSFHSNRLDEARAEVVHELRAWIRSQVEAEKALWDRIDRDLDTIKEAGGYREALDQPKGWTP